jgi:hypothetical protein
MTDLKTIKDKIAKLLAKAEGTDNVHEAEAFMQKVNALLEEYQIEMFEIRAHKGVASDPMGHQEGEFNVYASMMWAKMVLHMTAKYFGAKIIWEGKRKNHLPYRVFGPESARMTTELMIPYIVSQVRQQARLYAQDFGRTASVAQREVGNALSMRIARLLADAEAHRSELQSKALVPVDTTAEYVDDYYGGGLKVGRRSRKGYGFGAEDYADKISLNRQATAVGRKQIEG